MPGRLDLKSTTPAKGTQPFVLICRTATRYYGVGMRLFRLILLITVLATPVSAQAIRVGSAISLKDALSEIAKRYETASGERVELVFGSSGQIAAQVRHGAEIDLFISAGPKQFDDLLNEDLGDPATRRDIAHNRLVLIVPVDAKDPPGGFASLVDASVGRVAIGDPATVPAGQYAAQVFESLGLREGIAGKLVYGKNVRQVLAYVERGEVSAGVVYATDASQSGEGVRVVAIADTQSHDPIVYPSVIIRASRKREAAGRFQAFVAESEDAKAILIEKGFVVTQRATPEMAEQ